jgi:hypothetical protein
VHPLVHPVSFVQMRIWNANPIPKMNLPKFYLRGLANNTTVAQGKLLLEIIKNTL